MEEMITARSIPKEELRLFLTDVIHPSLNDIDIRRVSSSLRNDDAITRGEFQRLSLDKGLEEANSVFYGILDNDTSVRKLESLYKAFLEDNTHDCHQKLAVIIKDFLDSPFRNQDLPSPSNSSPSNLCPSQSTSGRQSWDTVTLTIDDLNDVLKVLGYRLYAQYRIFGIHLKVDPHMLDSIRSDCYSIAEKCFSKVVEKWLKEDAGTGNLKRNWISLKAAVKLAGSGVVYEDVCSSSEQVFSSKSLDNPQTPSASTEPVPSEVPDLLPAVPPFPSPNDRLPRSPHEVINEAIRTFLKREDVKNIWEKYSNLKHVANDLVAKGALMDDEYFAVCDCKTHIQVNQCLWSMYYRNPDQKKLQVLARALQADQSHSNNCKLGSMIEEYLDKLQADGLPVSATS